MLCGAREQYVDVNVLFLPLPGSLLWNLNGLHFILFFSKRTKKKVKRTNTFVVPLRAFESWFFLFVLIYNVGFGLSMKFQQPKKKIPLTLLLYSLGNKKIILTVASYLDWLNSR